MKFRLSLRGGQSFEAKQQKAAAVFVKPTLRRDKGGHVVPPLNLTKGQQNLAKAQRAWAQQAATTRSNWAGALWESRHEGVGTAYSFMHGGEARYGGTIHHAEDRTIQHSVPPGESRQFKPVPGTQGPPVPAYQPRPFPDRIRETLEDPAAYQPPPILDLRGMLGDTARAIFMAPAEGPRWGFGDREPVSWPQTDLHAPGRIENPDPPPGYRS